MNKKPDQKDLWKAQQLEYLHNCFIGISNLTCSNSVCPLVYHWGEIEKKQSKKGKCAFYLISQKENKWTVVDLEKYEENDLGEYENIEIQFKSGKTQRTRPLDYVEPENQEKKEIFLKEEEIILFFNNSSKTPNLLDAETIYLDDLWDIKEKTRWDREKSKKKVFLFCENEPNTDTQAKKIDSAERDYLFYIANPDITNEIKNYEVYSPSKGTEERDRLYKDFHEELSELKETYGIRHNIQAKEERQNNPEIDMIKSPFLALERDKKREREKSIKDFEEKGGCSGKHILSYGSLGEHQAEMMLEEQIEQQEEEQEPSRNNRNNKIEETKQIPLEKHLEIKNNQEFNKNSGKFK